MYARSLCILVAATLLAAGGAAQAETASSKDRFGDSMRYALPLAAAAYSIWPQALGQRPFANALRARARHAAPRHRMGYKSQVRQSTRCPVHSLLRYL